MPLHPEVKLMLEAFYASDWIDPSQLTPLQAREQSARFAKLRQFPQAVPELHTLDINIPVQSNQTILARCYYPKNQTQSTVVIFYHGGGFVVGNVEQYDIVCRWMCSILEMPVISVDYRLSPESAFPMPVEDSYQALGWIASHFNQLNVSCDEIIVAGDSAGGHLATMVSILARDQSGPKISWQWLIYPWVDNDFTRQSYKTFGTGYGLSADAMKWFSEQFLSHDQPSTYSPFPLHYNLSNLPPSYVIVAENDVLRDEGKVYAEKLQSHGNTVHFEFSEGMVHGFINHFSVPASFNTTLKMFEKMKSLARKTTYHPA